MPLPTLAGQADECAVVRRYGKGYDCGDSTPIWTRVFRLSTFMGNPIYPTSADALVENWNGSAWVIATIPVPATPIGALHGIAKVQTIVPTPELWAVGDNGVLHATGATPTWVADTSLQGMKGVAAMNSKDVYAVGTAIVHYGGSWSGATHIPANSRLFGVTMFSGLSGGAPTRFAWAVGRDYANSVPLIMEQVGAGASWNVVTPATPTGSTVSWLYSIDEFGQNNIWAVGAHYVGADNRTYTLIEHWDSSQQWKVIDSPSPGLFYNELKSIFYTPEGDLWAVGSYSDASYSNGLHPLILRWTDQEWLQVDAPWIGADSELLGVGTSSNYPDIPANTFTPAPSPGLGNPAFVNSVWAVGRYQDIDNGSYKTLIEGVIAPTPTANTTPQSRSYYEFDADPTNHYNQGCLAAMRRDSGIIVLDYGRAVDACVGPLPCTHEYGALPFPKGKAYATVTVPQIVSAADNFVLGYYNAFYHPDPTTCPQATGTPQTITLALAITNSKDDPPGTVLPPLDLTYGHAHAWATAVATVEVYVQQRPTALPMSVAAAVDFEPGWSNYDDTPTPGQTLTPNSPRAWATAYSSTPVAVYYDFGSADGYPAPAPNQTPTPRPAPWACCSPWSVDQL